MLTLPGWMITIVTEFAPAIYGISTWYKVEVLVAGAILARGRRTVSAVLRVMGLGGERKYAMYHHVLNGAVWSSLEMSAILLRVLVSYKELARRIGRPNSVRAVGQANGHNPVSIIVPCHRVIGANGTLTGYGGGLERKAALLDFEAAVRVRGPHPFLTPLIS